MKKALYDCFDYPRYWQGRKYEDQAERIALKRFFKKIPQAQKDSLVDIGGGYGRLANLYAPIFRQSLIVDPSKRLLKQAQKYLKSLTNVTVREGSVESIPCHQSEFNVALLIRVIHHLPDPYLAFLEAYRVLKPGGYFILEFANKVHFLACLRAWTTADFRFRRSIRPADQNTQNDEEERKVLFLNHHPKFIEKKLKEAGFEVIDSLSVSNFRSPILKKILPLGVLLFFESICQKILCFCHFGPSIFLLCRKI